MCAPFEKDRGNGAYNHRGIKLKSIYHFSFILTRENNNKEMIHDINTTAVKTISIQLQQLVSLSFIDSLNTGDCISVKCSRSIYDLSISITSRHLE